MRYRPWGFSTVWLLLIFSGVPLLALGGGQDDVHWPSFRGRQAQGVAEGFSAPTEWSVEDEKNIRWKTPIPGLAHSSPIIWGDRLFVTTAVSTEGDPSLRVGLYGDIASVNENVVQSWRVYALDKSSGEVLWDRTAHQGVPKVKRHPKSTHANPTPATDGEHVVVFFGSEGLYCYDMDGELLWKKDLGVLISGFFQAPEAQWGFASSPIIHDDKVIVQSDVLGEDSFLAAFDIRDGREIWRSERDDVPTWSTPTVHARGDDAQLIVNGLRHIGGYDLATGERIWWMTGGGDIPVPAPVVAGPLVFITNAHGPASPIYAVRLDAKGDISLSEGESANEHIAWSVDRGGAYMQTPVVHGNYLYNCRDNGVLSCYRAVTGERLYQERLGGGTSGFSASPVAADGKVYFTSEEGDVYVVASGPKFELLAVNSLDEIAMATPAVSEGVLYFRTRGHVIAVAADKE
jgi:outer membrane protein assembly factor BamB